MDIGKSIGELLANYIKTDISREGRKDYDYIERRNKSISTILQIIVENGNLDQIKYLVNAEYKFPSKQIDKPLYTAAELNKYDIVEYLLQNEENDCDGNIRDEEKYESSRTEILIIAIKNGHYNVVEILLKYGLSRGIDINRCSNFTVFPLNMAIFYGHCDIIKLLLDNGAILNYEGIGSEEPALYM